MKHPGDRDRRNQSQHQSAEHQDHAFRQDLRQDGAWLRAQCQADSKLACALSHRVRDDAVKANDSEQPGQDSESRKHHGTQARRPKRLAAHLHGGLEIGQQHIAV
jgi:hypothetical protein